MWILGLKGLKLNKNPVQSYLALLIVVGVFNASKCSFKYKF